MNRLTALLLGLAISPAFALPEPEWQFGLNGSWLRENYPKGTLTTFEARISPGVQLGNLNLYANIPWYGKEADFSGVVSLTGPRGRVLATRTVSRNQTFEGAGDMTLGGSYAFPLDNEDAGLYAGLNYKLDNGDETQLLGSGTLEVNATLDGDYRLGPLTLEAGAGHAWSHGNLAAGAQDAWLFWSAGLRYDATRDLTLALRWTDQEAPSARAPDQGMTRVSLTWKVGRQWSVTAGYGRHQAGKVAGQAETEAGLGLSWQL